MHTLITMPSVDRYGIRLIVTGCAFLYAMICQQHTDYNKKDSRLFQNSGNHRLYCIIGLSGVNGIITNPMEWPKPILDSERIIWNDGKTILKPIMWYGLPNQDPLDIGTAAPFIEEMFEDDAEEVFKRTPIWFKDDGWDELADIIGDYDEGFMIWFSYECGLTMPGISDIKKRCPVDWNEQDTQESLDDKISRYMLKKMLEK